jgi:tetratricopeptide (TPR) repeat protein
MRQSLVAFAAWAVLSGLTMLPPAALAMTILISPASAEAGDAQDDLAGLARQASALSRDGKFAEAAVFAARALELAEQRFGPQDPVLAQALSNLAYLYLKLNRYSDAESLYARAVAIYEVTGHHEGALWDALQRLAEADRALGRTAESDALLTRARAIEQMMSALF